MNPEAFIFQYDMYSASNFLHFTWNGGRNIEKAGKKMRWQPGVDE